MNIMQVIRLNWWSFPTKVMNMFWGHSECEWALVTFIMHHEIGTSDNETHTRHCFFGNLYLYSFHSKFTELLKMICWPLTKETSTKALEVWEQKQYDFSLCFKHLMSIDKNRCQYSKTRIPNLEDAILLPIELLLDPIRKRFRFHFYGSRKTNSREKVWLTLLVC